MEKLFRVFLCAVLLFSFPLLSFAEGFDFYSLPAYSGRPFAEVNGNIPFFTKAELTDRSFESYSDLDVLGRCGTAYACVGFDLMPTQERGNIGNIRPSGWQLTKYDIVDGKYLYNRCHLIGWQLTDENANRKNLITGTRYLNMTGMLPFEDQTADFIKAEHAAGRDTHVLYRVTPVFEGSELVARGVLMEALSVEDGGAGVRFCVFCYNVQPGIVIRYADGTSRLKTEADDPEPPEPEQGKTYTVQLPVDYVLNTSTKKIHLPSCQYARDIALKNREECAALFDDLLSQGYSACKVCKPETVVPETRVYLYGDVDLNGKIGASDARLALRASILLDKPEPIPSILADVDFSGSLTAADARIILRAAVKLEVIR